MDKPHGRASKCLHCRSHTGYTQCIIVSCVPQCIGVSCEIHCVSVVLVAHICCIVFDAYKWDHDLPQHGCFEAVFHFHRASLGLVPSIHTLDGPVTSKLKQGTATVSCSSLTERTVVIKE